mgnify:CR=1 FL=1
MPPHDGNDGGIEGAEKICRENVAGQLALPPSADVLDLTLWIWIRL